MKTMIILTLIAGAAAQITAPTMTCSISCTQETATEPIMVLHDTTTAHTHARCYNDPTANVCRCECCTDTTDDCSDTSNYVNNPVCAAGFHAVPQNDINGVCVACSSGTFDNNADGLGVCEDHTQCTSIYEHLDGHSDTAAGSCAENICSCPNGTPVANDSCTSHGDVQCEPWTAANAQGWVRHLERNCSPSTGGGGIVTSISPWVNGPTDDSGPDSPPSACADACDANPECNAVSYGDLNYPDSSRNCILRKVLSITATTSLDVTGCPALSYFTTWERPDKFV